MDKTEEQLRQEMDILRRLRDAAESESEREEINDTMLAIANGYIAWKIAEDDVLPKTEPH